LLGALEKRWPRNRQVRTMLARCELGLKREQECRLLLKTVFQGRDACVGEELFRAFVYRQFGLLANAVAEMEKLLKKHGDLPTVYFVLGNLLLQAEKREQAAGCYRKAIELDTRTGAVAASARRKLQKIEEAKRQIAAYWGRRLESAKPAPANGRRAGGQGR
jgi:tetratricopeptide (TPR) repeat protein